MIKSDFQLLLTLSLFHRYGKKGFGAMIPPNATLHFDICLKKLTRRKSKHRFRKNRGKLAKQPIKPRNQT